MKKKINQIISDGFWLDSIVDKFVWFFFQFVMKHASNTKKEPSTVLKYLLKFLSMFKNMIWYDNDDFKKGIGINFINLNKVVGYE